MEPCPNCNEMCAVRNDAPGRREAHLENWFVCVECLVMFKRDGMMKPYDGSVMTKHGPPRYDWARYG